MRYCSPDANDSMVDARNDYWMPMDQYIGGIEHAVLHLLYARFWTKVMRDLNLVHFDEPFTNLFTQGMLSAESFYRTDAAGKTRWYYPDEVEVKHDQKGRPTGALARVDGAAVMLGGMEKMSKSKNNIVEPKDIIERYGADTARAYVMFAGPPDQSAAWSDSGAGGVYRFLQRLWSYCATHQDAMRATGIGAKTAVLRFTVHSLLKQAQYDFDHLKYNTVVSACMKMLNAIEDAGQEAGAARNECVSILLRVLYPLAPHIAHQLWQDLGFASEAGVIIDAAWPAVDPGALEQDEIELVVQVNGKLRGHIRVSKSATKEAIEQLALGDDGVKRHTEGKPVKKLIVVPGKLVNVVV
jgi:leucyl-tRNA synthetase